LEIQSSLFAGMDNPEVDKNAETEQSVDTKGVIEPTTESVLNWQEIVFKGYDGIIRTIEGDVYQEYPTCVLIKRWGIDTDRISINRNYIISQQKKIKPDPRELIIQMKQKRD
jgi:hypothetical protein